MLSVDALPKENPLLLEFCPSSPSGSLPRDDFFLPAASLLIKMRLKLSQQRHNFGRALLGIETVYPFPLTSFLASSLFSAKSEKAVALRPENQARTHDIYTGNS